MSSPGSGSVYSVTIKPSTRSARSIAVTSVLKLWRHGGRRDPPIWLRPAAALRGIGLEVSDLRFPTAQGRGRGPLLNFSYAAQARAPSKGEEVRETHTHHRHTLRRARRTAGG